MSSTLLRIGLYMLVFTLVLYVIDSSYPDSLIAELITIDLLQKLFTVCGLLIVGGLVLRIFETGARKVAPKNRCKVCKTQIPPGAIYCRQHLRNVLELEDRRTHSGNTRVP